MSADAQVRAAATANCCRSTASNIAQCVEEEVRTPGQQ